MKKALVSISLTLLLISALYLPNAFTQYQDYMQLNLPEGAKARFGKGSIRQIAYSPDGTRLAVASSIGIWLHDLLTSTEPPLIAGHLSGVKSVAFSPDGDTIASGSSDKTVRLWNAGTGKHLRTLTGHTGVVYSLAFSPDGKTLASGSTDGTVILWELIP